jgi:Domain of unknown function (DUF6468)
MSSGISLLADLLVATLLVATISTSLVLSRRIRRLKADESTMRKTIGELVVATETAERAIAGLRATLGECDRTLAERLKAAERYSVDLAQQVGAGEAVMSRIAKIVEASRLIEPVKAPASAPVSTAAVKLKAAAARAEALAERAVRRLENEAA